MYKLMFLNSVSDPKIYCKYLKYMACFTVETRVVIVIDGFGCPWPHSWPDFVRIWCHCLKLVILLTWIEGVTFLTCLLEILSAQGNQSRLFWLSEHILGVFTWFGPDTDKSFQTRSHAVKNARNFGRVLRVWGQKSVQPVSQQRSDLWSDHRISDC